MKAFKQEKTILKQCLEYFKAQENSLAGRTIKQSDTAARLKYIITKTIQHYESK